MTESERLFELFCRQNDLRCARITPSSERGERRPDFRVRRTHCRSVVVEIKQVEPNREEAAAIRAESKRGYFDMPSVEPGKKIRGAIGDSGPQLKTLTQRKYPGILLLYDTLPGGSLHTDPYSVLTAMRGLDVIDVIVPMDRSDRPIFGKTRPGPGRKLRADAHTTISAIAIMHRVSARRVAVGVFHNRFAAVRLAIAEFCGGNVNHYHMSADLSRWVLRTTS